MCCMTSCKTNTFLAVDENKMRARWKGARSESWCDIYCIYMHVSKHNMFKKKKKRWKGQIKCNWGDHHSHTDTSISSQAKPFWTSNEFRPSCMSTLNERGEGQHRRQEQREEERRGQLFKRLNYNSYALLLCSLYGSKEKKKKRKKGGSAVLRSRAESERTV